MERRWDCPGQLHGRESACRVRLFQAKPAFPDTGLQAMSQNELFLFAKGPIDGTHKMGLAAGDRLEAMFAMFQTNQG